MAVTVSEVLEDGPMPAEQVAAGHSPIVVVGAGPVGIHFTQRVLDRYPTRPMVIYGNEAWAPYDRVRLTSLLAGDARIEQLDNTLRTIHAARLVSHWNCPVEAIDRDHRQVRDALGRWQPYSQLVLAVGSRAAVPEVPGIDLPGVFTLRDLGDVEGLVARRVRSRHTVVLGGGLLGLETARAMQKQHTRVTLVHRGPRVLNRQLDEDASAMLLLHLEQLGIDVALNAGLRAVLGERGVSGILLGDGRRLDCDTLIIAIGIRPNTELARQAGLSVGQGIRVDDTMRTSDPSIYAIGECAEHRGAVHGLVAPGIEQADVAVHNVLGGQARYGGSIQATALKVLGRTTFSCGRVGDAEEPILDRATVYRDSATGDYRRLVIRRGRAVGAVVVGDWPELGRVREAVIEQRRIWPWQRWRLRRTGRVWPEQAGRSVRQWPADAVVCNCRGVDRGTLCRALDNGANTLQALMDRTGASTVCGSCRPLLQELVADSAAPAVEETSTPKPWPLLLLSLLAMVTAVSIALLAPIPYRDTVQGGFTLDVLWSDSLWKQSTGYTLLGLSLFGMMLSLSKRTSLRLGGFSGWRLVHVALGLLVLGVLLLHTGLHLGENLNRILMLNFLALALLGSLAGAVIALERRIPAPWGGRLRRFWSWLHILILWPLPVLLAFHVLVTYYY